MATHNELEGLIYTSWRPGGALVEVGSQRAAGKGSSYLLAELAKNIGVSFYTVDASEKSYQAAKDAVGEAAYKADGVDFLKRFRGKISILYLDNYDIVYSDQHAKNIAERMGDVAVELKYTFENANVQNTQSIFAHLDQARAALPKMTDICVIAVDDTVPRDQTWWGKGALVVPFLLHNGFRILKKGEKGVIMSRNLNVKLT